MYLILTGDFGLEAILFHKLGGIGKMRTMDEIYFDPLIIFLIIRGKYAMKKIGTKMSRRSRHRGHALLAALKLFMSKQFLAPGGLSAECVQVSAM